jgi:large subunit ribosomal protein L31
VVSQKIWARRESGQPQDVSPGFLNKFAICQETVGFQGRIALYAKLKFPATLQIQTVKGSAMKAGIHPAYEEINVICACGHKFRTRSAHKGDIRVEICSNCHPFFTGKQKLIDTEGRVDRFQKKYQKVREAAEAAAAAKKKPSLN